MATEKLTGNVNVEQRIVANQEIVLVLIVEVDVQDVHPASRPDLGESDYEHNYVTWRDARAEDMFRLPKIQALLGW